jgi:hypothetical protein
VTSSVDRPQAMTEGTSGERAMKISRGNRRDKKEGEKKGGRRLTSSADYKASKDSIIRRLSSVGRNRPEEDRTEGVDYGKVREHQCQLFTNKRNESEKEGWAGRKWQAVKGGRREAHGKDP